ncbi:MAG: ABC-2 family transporter protein [Acidimicrobiia bacterium]
MADVWARGAHASAMYRHFVAARIRADWQYRTSFLLMASSQFAITFLDFIGIAIVFGQVPQLAGWSFADVAFLYGTSGMAFTLCDVFVSEVELVSRHIRLGTFDQFLLRPVGALLQICAQEFALRRAGKLVQSTLVLGLALAWVSVSWSIGRVVMVVVTVSSGSFIFGALIVMTACVSFWSVESNEVANSVTYGGNFASQYPLDLYGTWLRRLLVIVPIAFVSYLPSTWILDKPDGLGLPQCAAFISPVVAALMTFVACVVWRAAVRHYRSTGS